MKYLLIVSLMFAATLTYAGVYDKDDKSLFPNDVRQFINMSVKNECDQEGWYYGAYNEEIDSEGIFSATLSVSSLDEDYEDDAYIVVERQEDKLVLVDIECPLEEYTSWDW